MPDDIYKLYNLERLDFHNNNFNGPISEKIGYLKKLTYIDFSNCNIDSIPYEFVELENLKSLCISNNNITILPECILKLKNLKDLHICGNNIKNFPIHPKKYENLNIGGLYETDIFINGIYDILLISFCLFISYIYDYFHILLLLSLMIPKKFLNIRIKYIPRRNYFNILDLYYFIKLVKIPKNTIIEPLSSYIELGSIFINIYFPNNPPPSNVSFVSQNNKFSLILSIIFIILISILKLWILYLKFDYMKYTVGIIIIITIINEICKYIKRKSDVIIPNFNNVDDLLQNDFL
jgi:hypothetical protein